MTSFLPGLALGFSLILAIGAQNAFVLRHGLMKLHVFWICLTCAASDALLIAAGVAGFGWAVTGAPWIEPAFTWAGAAFLVLYGGMALRSALRGTGALEPEARARVRLAPAIATCLALTWLNPHVYLDTVVLLGSVSSTYPDRIGFALGAITASFVFFFGLGYGARLLAPLFARPGAWRVLDVVVGLTMWSLAAMLLLR